MYFLDTNIVLRLFNPSAPEHEAVRRAVDRLEAQLEPLVLGLQVLVETWVVATRPTDRNGFGMSPDAAHALIVALRQRFAVLVDDETTTARWSELVRSVGISGKRAHDARIAALMQTHGVTKLLTLNDRDFQGMPGVDAVHPNALTAG